MKAVVVALALLGGLAPADELDSLILATMERFHIPGLAACIVKDGFVTWHSAYGVADIETGRPMTETTAVNLASVSKTYTGTALMQLWEAGRIDLDREVGDYLPFRVRHPGFPTTSITPRMLLLHTSGIQDNWSILGGMVRQGDPGIALDTFLYNYLTPGGSYYDSARNFTANRPGSQHVYSSVGSTLEGLIIQSLLDSFHLATQDSLFHPLGLARTAWYFRDFDTLNLAVPYWWTGSTHYRFGHQSLPVVPAGFLKSSALEMGNLLTTFLNWGRFQGVAVLDSYTVSLMTRVLVSPNIGMHWYYGTLGSHNIWYHYGQWNGTSTHHSFSRDEGTGVAVVTNVQSDSIGFALNQYIIRALYNYAPSTGVGDGRTWPNSRPKLEATIVRGVLELPASSFTPHASSCLLDISGRKVMTLRPGANDVSRLAPGVYFVRAVSRGLSAESCHKVVIQR
jgi:CubicO group peptidase (beta-lactamase class C family)